MVAFTCDSTGTEFTDMKTTNFLEIREDTLKTVLTIYNRTEESLLEDVTTIQEWMKTQPHLPEILNEKIIRNFLILNKCSVERSKLTIDAYYTIRSQIPDVYENINPKLPNMTEMMEILYLTTFPKPTQEMYRIGIFKLRNKEMIDNLEPLDVCRHMLNIQELKLHEDIMCGDIIIFDMEGINLTFISKVTPAILAKCLAIYEKVFSIQLKSVYVINSLSFVNIILTILKSVMKPKLFQRIHVCQDTSILKENFPKELLPKDYGGEQQSIEELQEWLKLKFQEHQARFDQLDKLRVVENLRAKKLENDEFLGFHGNFKKLNVD